MRTDWMGAIALVLSAITLAIVLSIALRPAQEASDSGLARLHADAAQVRADIAALRVIVDRPIASERGDQLAVIQARLDALDSAVAAIAGRFSTLCTAINSSPFSPPGGAC